MMNKVIDQYSIELEMSDNLAQPGLARALYRNKHGG